jgi:hypothetical protein
VFEGDKPVRIDGGVNPPRRRQQHRRRARRRTTSRRDGDKPSSGTVPRPATPVSFQVLANYSVAN